MKKFNGNPQFYLAEVCKKDLSQVFSRLLVPAKKASEVPKVLVSESPAKVEILKP